jgi:hypothetical protein
MKRSRTIMVPVFCGCLFYAAVLGEVIKYRPSISNANLLLWNIVVVDFLGGGDPGAPIYDGAAGFPGTTWVSFLSGFVIYPVLFYIAFTTRSAFKRY